VRKIDFVKLILVKTELNVKWFTFGQIHVLWIEQINLNVKFKFRVKNYKS